MAPVVGGLVEEGVGCFRAVGGLVAAGLEAEVVAGGGLVGTTVVWGGVGAGWFGVGDEGFGGEVDALGGVS